MKIRQNHELEGTKPEGPETILKSNQDRGSQRRRRLWRQLRSVTVLSLSLALLCLLGLTAAACAHKADPVVIPELDLSALNTTADEPVAPAVETWPLTGIPTVAGDDIHRRPLSIKIENTPMARPQMGISHADVVYESVTEGGITRFNCIFQSYLPVEVGPVRSARNTDISIVPQYQGLFFYSGANSTVNKEIKAAGIDNMGNTPAQSLYYRVNYREAPHNLYLKLDSVYDVAASLNFASELDTPSTLEFGPSTNNVATPASGTITVPLSPSYVASWTYDAASNSYTRLMNGTASTDAEAGQAIVASNVVILWAPYIAGVIANNSQTYNVDLTTSGPASIFMGGQRIDGTWEASANTPPRFKDTNGTEILLTPGQTWFEVVDTSIQVSAS